MAKYVSSDGLTYYNNKIKTLLNGKANTSHTHPYAGSASAGGSATSAVKLDTSTAGSATQPVYFSGGKPVACTYTLGKSVPSNAVFTDTYDRVKCYGDTGDRIAYVNPWGTATTPTGTAAYLAVWDYASDNLTATLKYMPVGDIGSYHTHKYAGSSSAGGSANSVANSLTIQTNGTTQATFNGSSAKSVNITASNIGAAASNHTHINLVDATDSTVTCNLSYKASSKKYAEYDWIAVWDGTTVKSASKAHFATAGHTHSTLVDAHDTSKTCSLAYSATDKAYSEYSYLAVWDGSTLKSALKTQFATSGHTHGTLVDPAKSGTGTTNYVSLSYYSPERTIGGTYDFSYLAAWNKEGTSICTVPRDLFLQASRVYHTLSTTFADYNTMPTQIPTIGTLSSWNGAYDSKGASVLAYCNQGAFSNGATTHITYGTSEPSSTDAKEGDIYILYTV